MTNTLIIEKTERVVENQPVGDGLPRIPITTCWSRPFLLPDPNVKVVDFYGDVMEDSVMYDVLINGRNVYYNCRRGNPPIVNEQIFSIDGESRPIRRERLGRYDTSRSLIKVTLSAVDKLCKSHSAPAIGRAVFHSPLNQIRQGICRSRKSGNGRLNVFAMSLIIP